MILELKQLGPYRIERTEDYDYAEDKNYAEMIRVRGSKPKTPIFMVPSNLYKYSESELALYLKDKKNLWSLIGKLLNEDIDILDEELVLRFPVKMLPNVAKIVPFVRKRGSGKLSPELIARRDALNARRHTDKIGQTASRPPTKEGEGNSSSHTISAKLEDFSEGGDDEPGIDEPILPVDPGDVADAAQRRSP